MKASASRCGGIEHFIVAGSFCVVAVVASCCCCSQSEEEEEEEEELPATILWARCCAGAGDAAAPEGPGDGDADGDRSPSCGTSSFDSGSRERFIPRFSLTISDILI